MRFISASEKWLKLHRLGYLKVFKKTKRFPYECICCKIDSNLDLANKLSKIKITRII